MKSCHQMPAMLLRVKPKRPLFTVVLLAMTQLLASCSTLDELFATPIAPTPTETPLPTATINWFPASATPTLQVLSTQPPTPEMRPGIGDEIISDDFFGPSLWNIYSCNQ